MNAEIDIQQLGLMGQGVGYDADGNIYFVPGALPGDRVAVEFEGTTKKYRDATLLSLVSPSVHRKIPECANFGVCGGCDWLDFEYEAQIQHKAGILDHVVKRSSFVPKTVLPFLASEKNLGYRSRIQLKISNGEVGFFKRRSHDLVSVENCAVAEPKLNELLAGLKEEAKNRAFTNVELSLEPNGEVSRAYDAPHGSMGFTQVNRAQNEVLKSAVADRVRRAGSRSVLELFCGDGNLTFAFANDVERVVGIDAGPAAIERAVRAGVSFPHVSFIESAVGASALKKLPTFFKDHYDTLVLDPPRAGAGGSLKFFVQPFVKNVIYISCSPLTFSKDIFFLKAAGFSLEDIQGLDMFPHTRHIELVARFQR